MPRRYWGDWRLGEWVADARQAHKEKRLTPAQVAALEELGFPWKVPQVCGFGFRVQGISGFAGAP